MALNYIWLGLFLIGMAIGALRLVFLQDYEALPSMMDSTFEMAKTAFEMALGLTGTITLWMGIMNIGQESGLINKLAKYLSPVLRRLFPDIPENHPALGSVFMNISANMLGLDNAATPMGLKAMGELQSLNDKKDTASNSMIMFLTLNTSGLTIIPVSIMAYRQIAGAQDPSDVFIPILLTTMCSTLMGLTMVCIYQKINLFHKETMLLGAVICALVAALFTAMHGLDQAGMQQFCRQLTAILILGAIAIFLISGMRAKLNVYDAFIKGAKEGFGICVSLIPYMVAILAAIGVFKASGALAMIQNGLTWAVDSIGWDTDFVNAVPVAILKPLNGGGARGMMLEIFNNPSYGPDSFVGHLASVLQGSTDTTFYILAIYFGSVGVKKYRHAITCGLLADLAGIIAAILFSYFFFHA